MGLAYRYAPLAMLVTILSSLACNTLLGLKVVWCVTLVAILGDLVRGTRASSIRRCGVDLPRLTSMDFAIYLAAHLSLVWIAVRYLARDGNEPFQDVAVASAVAWFSAIYVMPVAHEMIHGRRRVDRFLGWVTLASFGYGHFATLHTDVHHVAVATGRDPSTPRIREPLYTFMGRTLVDSTWIAYGVAKRDLRHRAYPAFCARVAIWAVPIGSLTVAAAVAGAAGFMLIGTMICAGIFIVEASNYVQHYGLERQLSAEGGMEPIRGRHCWDTDRPLSDVLLVGLGRHGRHHTSSSVREDGIAAPLGHLAMILVAVVPWIWMPMMERAMGRRTAFPIAGGLDE